MRYLSTFWQFMRELVARREIIVEMTKRDFKSKYLGSYLGILWAFVQPTVYILILWFVFGGLFKSQPVNGIPFPLWLMAGMIPWFFFNDALVAATGSILENSFLVKKVAFSIGILPIVKILSTLVIHLFFIFILILLFMVSGAHLTVYAVQLPYYLFCSIVFLVALSWITSSVVIFLRDLSQIVAMALQFLFWGTPLFWSVSLLPAKWQPLIKLNPVVYLVEGYRDCFVNRIWIWQHWLQGGYFWLITMILFISGAIIFRRLRPHFADVL